jgi:hypothetical protein
LALSRHRNAATVAVIQRVNDGDRFRHADISKRNCKIFGARRAGLPARVFLVLE